MITSLNRFKALSLSIGRFVSRRNKVIIFVLGLVVLGFLLGYSSVYAISVPSLVSPADGSTVTSTGYGGSIDDPPLAIPEFVWTSVEGATRYRIQFSQNIGFTTKFEFTTPLTHFTPPSSGQFSDGQWFWRVRVDAPEASNYSQPNSFTRQWASPDNYPLLTAPTDGETLEFYDYPSFSWQPVTGAAYYRFQIAAAQDFSSLLHNITTLATTHQPPTKLANGTYYWRVIPLDPNNREGTYSQVRSFNLGYNQIPQQLEPGDNTTPTFTPTFRWSAVRGAQLYRLQYSTDPSFNTAVTTIDTRNTTYTPLRTLPNDVNYYWRVRTHSGNSISDWSPVWDFMKQWYIQPKLLTPVNLYQYVRFPLFNWTPVPGASYYKVEIDTEQDFNNPKTGITSNPFFFPQTYEGDEGVRYWRVTPYDRNNRQGKTSTVSSYVSSAVFSSPDLVYPYYYYPPNDFPPPDDDVVMDPHVDRTVPSPIFMWHRLTEPYPTGGTFAHAYKVQVSTTPLFTSVVWDFVTENTIATPTTSDDFQPTAGEDYYWRVRPLDGSQVEIGQWSQIWRTRIDTSQTLTPTTGTAPELIRPAQAAEFVEATPLLEWWPYQGADAYTVEISDDPDFNSTLVSETVSYPAYASQASLAQRFLNRLDYGTFYWRVRASSGGSPVGDWSETWRFQIASQSEWLRSRTIGDTNNRLEIASDPDDTPGDDYELTKLYASQDSDHWYFGFDVTSVMTETYALYLDLDQQDFSGGDDDPLGNNFSTIAAHRPEFVVYLFEENGGFSADQVLVYAWGGTSWGSPNLLSNIGGDLYTEPGYVEIEVPNTAIGMEPETGSYALTLVSFPRSGGDPQDSVPSDPEIPGSGVASRFTAVSEHMNLVFPPNNIEGDPTTFPTVLPFYWDYPTGSGPYTPWAGARMEAYLDPQFTTRIAEYKLVSNTPYYASTYHPWPNDFDGDNSYYWRVQPRYLDGSEYLGSWSQGWRFERVGFIPQNLQESVAFATPTFQWDMVKGAESYDLQVDKDPNFGSPDISINTAQNSYTPQTTLSNGNYYWRVRARRRGGIVNEWSPANPYSLDLPVPTGLTPDDPSETDVIDGTPTYCYDPVIVSDDSADVLAAYQYRIQVSKGDPTFSAIYDTVITQQSCWTPTKGYGDGKYYWRVAMIDGQGRRGEYSEPAEFTKQYPVTTLVSPVDQEVSETPTFRWTTVDGAASYRLEISKFETFSPLYDSVTTNNIRYTPTKLYDIPVTYYWRVAIIDKNGNYGPFTDATIILDEDVEKIFLPVLTSD